MLQPILKRLCPLALAFTLAIASFALPGAFTAHAAYDPAVYDTGDVAVINRMIAENGLDAKEDDPGSWGFASWEPAATGPLRIVALVFPDQTLTGDLDVRGITALRELTCSSNNLTGLDASGLPALKLLNCYDNAQLSSLNIDQSTALTTLDCSSNNLSTLDVSQNKDLTKLICNNNSLSELDVSQNKDLTSLYCNFNNLSALDVSQNKALTTLGCRFNSLSALDVSQNKALTTLSCSDNNLSQLDVSQNKDLKSLYCVKNNLLELDVSQNKDLTDLYCEDNNLSQLDISQNRALSGLYLRGNPLSTINASQLVSPWHIQFGANPQPVTAQLPQSKQVVFENSDALAYVEISSPDPTQMEISIYRASNDLTPNVISWKLSGQLQNDYQVTVPYDNYTVSDIYMDGAQPPSAPTGAAPSTYTINATAGVGGSISPAGKVAVTSPDSKTFTFTPENGYTVKDVIVDGVSVGAKNSYTFANVNAGHSISVEFVGNDLKSTNPIAPTNPSLEKPNPSTGR